MFKLHDKVLVRYINNVGNPTKATGIIKEKYDRTYMVQLDDGSMLEVEPRRLERIA